MKIAVVLHDSYERSGATQSMLTLITKWKKMGVDVVVLAPIGGNIEKPLKDIEVPLIRLKRTSQSRVNLRRPFIRRLLVRIYGIYTELRLKNYIRHELSRQIEPLDIDVIYSNTSACITGYELSKKLKLPLVWHIREFGDLDQNCDYILGKKRLCEKIDKANLIVTISEAIYNNYKPYLHHAPVIVAYDDISPDYNNYFKRDWNKNCLEVLSCGSLNPGKGHLDVIKAVAKVHEEGYDINLNVAGSGKMYEHLYTSLIEELNAGNYVKMLGQVSDMTIIRKGCDIAIVASRMEAFGRVTVEAMLSGMLVVGANSGGTAELINDNETGLLFEVGNIKQMSDKLKWIFNHREESMRIADRGYVESQRYIQGTCAEGILDAIMRYIPIVK